MAQIKVHHNGSEKLTFLSLASESCFHELQQLIKYLVEEVKDSDSLSINRLDHNHPTNSLTKIYRRRKKALTSVK